MHFEQRIPVFLELGFREDGLKSLRQFIDLLWDGNQHLNLISRKMSFEDLIDNHLIDCLLAIKYFPQNIGVAGDFGAGGGLPGVVFAIQFPQTRFRLYEKSKLKQDFLSHCKEFAPNMDILGEIPHQLGKIEIVTSRAFKPIDVILEMSRSYYEKGGRYFLLKARKEKIDQELAVAKSKFKDLKIRIQPLKSPVLDVERHLVLIN